MLELAKVARRWRTRGKERWRVGRLVDGRGYVVLASEGGDLVEGDGQTALGSVENLEARVSRPAKGKRPATHRLSGLSLPNVVLLLIAWAGG
jgi:hypothetical protein